MTNVVVLIATTGGAGLSAEAAGAPPLERAPAGPPPLPIVGNGLGLKQGPYKVTIYNACHNFFGDGSFPHGKTLRLMLPIPQEDSQKAKWDIDYVPAYYEGTIMTADVHFLAAVLAADEQYPKMWTTAVNKRIQTFAGHGLFTDSTDSETWKTGHGLLPRSFNAIRVKNYFPIILEKTQAFVHEWAKLGSGVWVEGVNDWLTCMTADAVGKCALDFDMKNVERKAGGLPLHPFIEAFRFGLGYTFGSVKAENVVGSFNARFNPFCDPQQVMREKLGEAVGVCHEFVDELIEKTRSGEIGGPLSVLSMMLNERSPSTGDMVKLNDVFGHLMTIMIAGHETTAAALGHLFYYLGKNPRCVEKAVAEIEAVLGDRVNPTFADIGKLHYVEACFKEALRLHPSVPAVTRDVGNDTVILDKYLLRKGQRVIFNNVAIHRDPEQWDQGGAFGHPSHFNPERHMPGGPPRHPNAFAAFGFGVRACIGQQLAVLEAKTFLAMVLNFFSFSLPDGFQLVSSSKDGGASPSPENLRLHLTARPGGPLDRALKALLKGDLLTTTTTTTTPATQKPAASVPVVTAKHDTPLLILFGSNSGTCEDFAQQVATAAAARGFCPEVLSLDAGAKLELGEKFGAGVIITSTYNGTPPDNAATFASDWLPKQGAGSLAGKKFVVCGVGNTNWEATYQKFPTRVYETLRATSAEELMGFTAVDAANPSFVEDFQDWLDALMRTLSVSFGLSQVAPGGATPAGGSPPTKKEPAVRAVPPDAYASFFSTIAELYQYINATYPDTDLSAHVKADSFAPLKVTGSKQLQSPDSDRATCELEVALPEHLSYQAGDHLEVWAPNPAELVAMALRACGVGAEEGFEISLAASVRNKKMMAAMSKVGIAKIPATATGILQWIPDLSCPPSRKVITALAEKCECPPEAAALRKLAEPDVHKEEVLGKRTTLVELLLKFRSVQMNLSELVEASSRLPSRFYSISSSPLVSPRRATVTVGLVDFHTGTGRHHTGIASGKIHHMVEGNVIAGRVASLNSKFRLPTDPSTPVIMIGPGTGVAPMMGFLEERNELRKKGGSLGPAHLFFGCRSSSLDFIHSDLFTSYTESGVLSKDGLHVAFSRDPGAPKTYVQDLVQEEGDALWDMLQAGGKVYVCGDARRMAPDVRRGFCQVAQRRGGMTEVEAENWMAQLIANGFYLEDVWAG